MAFRSPIGTTRLGDVLTTLDMRASAGAELGRPRIQLLALPTDRPLDDRRMTGRRHGLAAVGPNTI